MSVRHEATFISDKVHYYNNSVINNNIKNACLQLDKLSQTWVQSMFWDTFVDAITILKLLPLIIN